MDTNINTGLSNFIKNKLNQDHARQVVGDDKPEFNETLEALKAQAESSFNSLSDSLVTQPTSTDDILGTEALFNQNNVGESTDNQDPFDSLFNSANSEFNALHPTGGNYEKELQDILNKIQSGKEDFVSLPPELEQVLDELINAKGPIEKEDIKKKSQLFFSFTAIQIDIEMKHTNTKTGEQASVRASASIFALSFTAIQYESDDSVKHLGKILEKLKDKPEHPLYKQVYRLLDKIRNGQDAEFIEGDENTKLDVQKLAMDALDLFKELIDSLFQDLPIPSNYEEVDAITELSEEETETETVTESDTLEAVETGASGPSASVDNA